MFVNTSPGSALSTFCDLLFSDLTGQPGNMSIPISLMSKLRLGDVKSISRVSWLQGGRAMMLV